MNQLETTYLGLKLKNPVIVGSSGLTSSIDKIKEIEKRGAGAIVLKSLFEEQINYEAGSLADTSDSPEALDYVKYYTKNNTVQEYLELIKKAKAEVKIPVIASINCVSAKDWVDFASQIEKAGADALEINVFILPNDRNASADQYENIYFDLAEKLKKILTIPYAFKLGANFTNLVGFIQKLHIPGIVLFNRFYAPDIDVDQLKFTASEVFSSPSDIRDTLRWVGIVSSKIPAIDIAASTGVHDGNAVIKQILAGAKAVQVCSTLYKNGINHLEKILRDVESWMQKHGFEHVDEFRGKMSYHRIQDPLVYERSQFMKYFSSIH
ncbi:MAG: dihydroorotate dehydrogenase-like protein [Bacteroidales bacterium]|jgi:dihydroorotate dehydrogenase (fumarate)|nr:dihydroorotate dehydrogenase-like protein [Bacteroidales bacterium]